MLAGRPIRLMAVMLAFCITAWLLVPVHELLHAAGCAATGGRVGRLEISPAFGGSVLARVFPWVVSGGDYAGRLAAFQPAGDLSYLATVLAPHVLLAAGGAAIARAAVKRRSPYLFGTGVAAAAQPIASLNGDMYEAASIPLTRAARSLGLSRALELRGDDVALVARHAAAIGSAAAWLLFTLGCALGVVLALLLLRASGGVAPRGVMGTP